MLEFLKKIRRLLRRASDVDCKTFAIFHLSPGCLASTIAPMVSFVAKPLDFLLSLLTPSCTRIMSTEVLHVKEDHNEFFSEYLKELDLILFTDGPKSWVKVFTLSHLNSFLISAPRFCETIVTCASSFSASRLKRPRIRGRQIYIWQLLWENMALSWL